MRVTSVNPEERGVARVLGNEAKPLAALAASVDAGSYRTELTKDEANLLMRVLEPDSASSADHQASHR